MEKTYDEVIDKAFLALASPDTVYAWLKESYLPHEARPVFFEGIPEEIEAVLLGRNNKLIDLGLAQWATKANTINALFARHCTLPNGAWPPEPDTFSYSILSAILSNTSIRVSFLEDHQGPIGLPEDAVNWIVEYGDENLTHRMHSNSSIGLGLIRNCCRRQKAYKQISDERWLKILLSLGQSERFKRPAKEYSDSPDLFHWDIHRPIVDAVRISPKTSQASKMLWHVFNCIAEKSASDAYIRDDDLKAAVEAWDVEITDNGDHLSYQKKQDSLTPGERVQFNLLRLYCSPIKLDPNDERRVYRLAAYSKCYFSGENPLKIEDFQKYSDRDGPAFIYAASFNGNIWSNEEASLKMSTGAFPAPEETEYLHYNRPSRGDVPKDQEDTHWTAEISDAGSELPALRTEIGNLHTKLAEEIGKAKSWMIWIAAAAVAVVKW